MFAKDSKSAMAGRLLIRKFVSEKMGIAWDKILLKRSENGKPFVANPDTDTRRWTFNVSHEGDFAVLAADPELEVGADVMNTNRHRGTSSVQEFFKLMTRQFTDHEWNTIKAMESEWKQLHSFYRHWALKESYIKAIGTGLRFNLQRIDFHLCPLQMLEGEVYASTTMYLDGRREDSWKFEESLLDQQHHVAVALGRRSGDSAVITTESGASASVPLRFTVLSFRELVSGAQPLSEEDPEYWESFERKQEAPRGQKRSTFPSP